MVHTKNKQTSEDNFGLSDLELGVKIQILKNPAINSEIAFILHLVLPTGANSVTNEHLGTVNKLARLTQTSFSEVRFKNCKLLGLHFEDCDNLIIS